MIRRIITTISLVTILLPMVVFAQNKIGFVQSDRIRAEYEEFKEAESQLQMEYQKVQVEYECMLLQLDILNKDYEVKRLMALDKGESIKQQMIQMELGQLLNRMMDECDVDNYEEWVSKLDIRPELRQQLDHIVSEERQRIEHQRLRTVENQPESGEEE